MLVINAIFGRRKGDTEQIFIDYTKCLTDLGCNLVVLTYQNAPILKILPENINVKTIPNFGQWDPLAGWKLKKAIKDIGASIIIAHGNRSSSLLSKATNEIPIISVCHNVNINQTKDCDALITVNDDLKRALVKKGHSANNIHTIPHMVYVPEHLTEKDIAWHTPPTIGALGRLIGKKGFNTFLKALSILKNRGVDFKAILGGDGIELPKLKQLAQELDIDKLVEFPGWVENKDDFFSAIDIFCLPSLHEPSGIVILEAFIHSLAVITSDTDGPMEIVRPHLDALMVEAGDPNALADAIEKLIKNPKFAEKIAKEGFRSVSSNFESKAIGKKLYNVIEKVIQSRNVVPKITTKATEEKAIEEDTDLLDA